MRKNIRVIQIIFGIPWLVFGLQHFMFADFVANLVPAYFPVRVFWVYLTGAAMIAAGLSFIANIKARLAAALLGLMLLIFILLLHTRTLTNAPSAINWMRALQDASIAASAFILAGLLSKGANNFPDKIAKISRYVFAALLIVFGIAQFLNLDFLTAKVAAFLPLRVVWVYLTGALMIVTGGCVLINKKSRLAASSLGILMLALNLLLYVYLLVNDLHNPLNWTEAMLNLAITGGVFFLAETFSEKVSTAAFESV